MASEFFGRQRVYRFYTAGCGNKMVVSVTGPHAANELGGPVIPVSISIADIGIFAECSPNIQGIIDNFAIYSTIDSPLDH